MVSGEHPQPATGKLGPAHVNTVYTPASRDSLCRLSETPRCPAHSQSSLCCFCITLRGGVPREAQPPPPHCRPFLHIGFAACPPPTLPPAQPQIHLPQTAGPPAPSGEGAESPRAHWPGAPLSGRTSQEQGDTHRLQGEEGCLGPEGFGGGDPKASRVGRAGQGWQRKSGKSRDL